MKLQPNPLIIFKVVATYFYSLGNVYETVQKSIIYIILKIFDLLIYDRSSFTQKYSQTLINLKENICKFNKIQLKTNFINI